jgi:putative transposase
MDAIPKNQAEQLAGELATQVGTLDDLNGLMRTPMKTALERMLNTEVDVHLGRRVHPVAADATTLVAEATTAGAATPPATRTRRSGHSKETAGGDMGEITLQTPRDRQGTSEPRLVAEGRRRLAGFDEKIPALHAKGVTTRDAQEIVEDLYGAEVSPTPVGEITADPDAEVGAWRTRRLESVRPIVYLDGIVAHARGGNGRVSQHTMDVAIGVNLRGREGLVGLWPGRTEGAEFWSSCLNDLRERGVGDSVVACVDGLTGFPEAIRTAFPQTKAQLRIVHLVRSALRYATDPDGRGVAADPKTIYRSAAAEEAEGALETLAAQWDAKYPTIAEPWRARWPEVVTLFESPPPIREAVYTTNAIESANGVIRKFTRNRKQYPNGASASKLVYLAIHEASRTWTMPVVGWKAALNHFASGLEGRLPTRPNG